MKINRTGSVDKYRAFSTKVQGASGVHELYITFGDVRGDVRLDWWQFQK